MYTGRNTEENNDSLGQSLEQWCRAPVGGPRDSTKGGCYNYEVLAKLLPDHVTGIQKTAFCHENGIRYEETSKKILVFCTFEIAPPPLPRPMRHLCRGVCGDLMYATEL